MTRFSPAIPIQATLNLLPRSSFIILVVSEVFFPQRCEASLSSAFPSSVTRYTGFGDIPSNIIPSKPDLLRSRPQKPAEFASPQTPVRGDFAFTLYLPVLGEGVPVNGPVIKINLFSGPNGSIPFGISSIIYLVAIPDPPKYNFNVSSSGNSSLILPFVKSTLRIFPI
ncbi:hypothetical protein ES703_62986 [subsurface metagenome]